MSKLDELLIECEKSIIFYTTHLETLRKQIDIIEEAKRLLKDIDANSELSEFIEMENLNNYNGYLTISTLDLAVNLKNIITSNTDWEKIFFIKNSYLIIHETLNKLKPPKSNFFLEKSIKKDYPSLISDFDVLMNEIIEFTNTSEYKKIIKVRHHTAGHIVDSLKRYYDTVKGLNGELAGKNIATFMKISNKALNLTKDYAILANDKSLEQGKDIQKKFKESLEKLNKLLKK